MRGYLEDLKSGGRPMTDKELAEHYKHLYSELKKQKDDAVEYIKSLHIFSARSNGKTLFAKILNEILRMLGDSDE